MTGGDTGAMARLTAALLAVLCVACGSETAATTDQAGVTQDSIPAASQTTAPDHQATTVAATAPGTDEGPGLAEPSEEDLAVFLAAVDELLVGTVYEGAAIGEPELFAATGLLFCDWLDAGIDADGVVTRYLDELAGGVDAADDDQVVLAGAMLGAAAGVLCPTHADVVG
jgi:hypothetical protein